MKKLLALMLALVMVFALAACGTDSGEPSSEPTTGASAEPSSVPSEGGDTANGNAESAAPSDNGNAESDMAYVQDKGTLIVGITNFEPMDYQDANGEWIGFDADLAKAFGESLGVEVQFQEITWDYKVEELNSRQIDVVWNGMTITDEVTSTMSIGTPYCTNYQVLVYPAASAADFENLTSLEGLNVAVESGSAGEEAAVAQGYNYIAVDTQADALMEVSAGTSDACIIDLLMAGAMIGEGTSNADLVHTVELTTEEYGVGFRKGSDLVAALNEFFAASYADGSMMACAETYGVQESVVAQ